MNMRRVSFSYKSRTDIFISKAAKKIKNKLGFKALMYRNTNVSDLNKHEGRTDERLGFSSRIAVLLSNIMQ